MSAGPLVTIDSSIKSKTIPKKTGTSMSTPITCGPVVTLLLRRKAERGTPFWARHTSSAKKLGAVPLSGRGTLSRRRRGARYPFLGASQASAQSGANNDALPAVTADRTANLDDDAKELVKSIAWQFGAKDTVMAFFLIQAC